MATPIPEAVRGFAFHDQLVQAGLTHLHSGKVCETFSLPGGKRIAFRTNRVSIFDFVLPCEIPRKGEVLTALTVFWLSVSGVLRGVPNHLVTFGRHMDDFLPSRVRHNDLLRRCGMLLKNLDMLPIESIVRGYLTGSAWSNYQQGKPVCGITLPPNLFDGAKLPQPLFTPTTKAEVGHDEELNAETITAQYKWLPPFSVDVYLKIAEYCEERGIIFVDTKFEVGKDGVLADEVGTPDSSRFWDFADWSSATAKRTTPEPMDKEHIRQWGLAVETPFGVKGLKKLDPQNPDHLAFVHSLIVPPDVITETAKRYQAIFYRLTGLKLDEFQQAHY